MNQAQLLILRNAIAAAPALAALEENGDTDLFIADYFNAPSDPAVPVWNPAASVREIMDTFDWSKFTPTDTVLQSNVDTASLMRMDVRLELIRTKQTNLQLMLQGRETVDATLARFRGGLRDALIAVPAGVNGASVAVAGVSAVDALNACTRVATRAEALYANATPQTTGDVSARIMTFVGFLSPSDVAQARAN
jgi:hypothetical protein